ncbi:PQQ-binding-like beta-propeller repeat protein [Streptomyces sp. NPDC021096]|uniref:outer membrane protein assembly factor BamB family protein n=1 Tax=Streptomyces sp. NPDC021096 TaxID=3154792 RepID=UPI0033FA0988
MTASPPPPPGGPARTPQIWDTDIARRGTAPPGFGPPPQPFGADPGGGGGAPRGRRKALIVVLALALVAGLGTGGWLLWGRTQKDPRHRAEPSAPPRVDTRLDWIVANPDKDKALPSPKRPATWFAHGNVIRTWSRQITALDVRQGKEQWRIALPGELCSASRRLDDDTAAVMYKQDGNTCTGLMAVDVKSGRQKWDRRVPLHDERTSDYGDPQVLVFRGRVKVMGSSESATFAAADGKVLEHPRLNPADNCMENRASTDGKTLLSVVRCSLGSDREFVQRIDPGTGREDWTWKAPEGLTIRGVLSVDPVVVTVGRTDSSDTSTNLISISPQGRTRAVISLTDHGGAIDAIVGKDTVYLASGDKETAASTKENRIVAIDLAKGEKRWETNAGGNRVGTPVGFVGDKPLFYQGAQSGEGGRLVTLDPRDGAPTVHKRMPSESSAEEAEVAALGEVYFHDDKVFVVAAAELRPKNLMMSFG